MTTVLYILAGLATWLVLAVALAVPVGRRLRGQSRAHCHVAGAEGQVDVTYETLRQWFGEVAA